jgi:hypothetical protein
MLTLNTTNGSASTPSSNPLEGRLLQHSNGLSYVYHDGQKFIVQVANMGDLVIDAIRMASNAQWETLFRTSSSVTPDAPGPNPSPLHGYF